MLRFKAILVSCLCLFILCLSYCHFDKKETLSDDSGFRNLHDTIAYVGKQTCRQCHVDIYETYMQTGMGRSFKSASRDKSSAYFDDHQQVYDEYLDLYYKPFWDKDSLKIMEFRMKGIDTVHKLTQTISYIVGSGQHTNSHLINNLGYLHQAPITFYTQKAQWDLAPGYEDGFNSRFSRVIGAECMTCHNGLPEMVSGSINKYSHVPQGIDCERCHGPGELHVLEKSLNILVDTSLEIDYSIINPAHLSIDEQLDLCQRCHLQGIAVLRDGKNWFDFKPGMRLKDVWNVYLPLYENEGGNFLMASQAERLRKSRCFIESMDTQAGSQAAISCIDCHNPHLSVKQTPAANYNQSCQSCHSGEACGEEITLRLEQQDNCSGCHMPKSGSIDIPHVSITDHNIQIPGKEAARSKGSEEDKFIKLLCYTDDNPESLEVARGYLKFYEAFSAKEEFLDSAGTYLSQSDPESTLYVKTAIHLAFLQNNKPKACALGDKLDIGDIKDGWTCYRLGESQLTLGSADKALEYFLKAVELEPFNLDFNYKLANTYSFLSEFSDAKRIYRFVLEENPSFVEAVSNLAFLLSQDGEIVEAESLYQRAIRMDPDYLQAKINLLNLYIFTRKKEQAKDLLTELKEIDPENSQVLHLAELLKQI